MDKRYQVFISSTFLDLQEERSNVIQTVMEMDCIPSGMEIFPAIDEEQFEFIKSVIDDCDYYIVIVGGRYGSTSQDGLSYTEKEYDYATSKGIKVIALLHKNPDSIPVSKSEQNDLLKKKLEEFRKKLSKSRLVRYWEKAEDLPGLVALSLSKTIKIHPAIGWVRANSIGNSELLSEVHSLKKEKEALLNKLSAKNSKQKELSSTEIDELKFKLEIRGTYSFNKEFKDWSTTIDLENIFYHLSPLLLNEPYEQRVMNRIAWSIFKNTKIENSDTVSLKTESSETIKVHLLALSLVEVELDDASELYFRLTDKGYKTMLKIRTQK